MRVALCLVIALALAALGGGPSGPCAAIPARERGPGAFRAFLDANGPALDDAKAALIAGRTLDPDVRALVDELDRLAGQRDALWSRLHWHTDLDAALAEARRAGKPVLSLRLLGRLDEGFSCANSRFFRVALYANESVSRVLRDEYVLHWSSERPVPRVTVDYGDGRTVETTVTGNSIHYVIDPSGAVLDALPGLYAPGTFRAILGRHIGGAEPGPARGRDAEIRAEAGRLLLELRREGAGADPPDVDDLAGPAPDGDPHGAGRAGWLAASKAVFQMPLVSEVTPAGAGGAGADGSRGAAAVADAWEEIAARYRDAARLDASSRSLLRAQKPGLSDAAFGAMVDRFERSIAIDTARNERVLRVRILEMIADPSRLPDRATGVPPAGVHEPKGAGVISAPPLTMDTLNPWVYAELFLTPAEDEWLGLFRPDSIYDGHWTD